MARLPRIDVPGIPQHLIVRGNNRGAMFRDEADCRIFLRFLEQALDTCLCDLHAYVLMTNHVHLLATGHAQGELSELMQRIGRGGLLAAHEEYLRLGATPEIRGARYRQLVQSGVADEDLARIRTSVAKCRALGREAFCADMGHRLARPVAPRVQGRPKRGQVEKLT